MATPTDQPEPNSIEQDLRDMQAVNEQLLLASLREQTEAERLRHQFAFITAITASLAEGVYVLDATGHCIFVNPAAEHMFGRTSDELHGKDMSIVVSATTANDISGSGILASIHDALHFRRSFCDDDTLFVHRDKGAFSAAYSAAPIITDEHVVGVVVTFRDMTEVRRLQHIHEEHIALISHDLRTPLTVIRGRAQILLRQLTQQSLATEAHSAKIIEESSLRINEMIESFLNRSDLDRKPLARHRSELDLATLVQQIIDQTVTPDTATQVTLHAAFLQSVIVDTIQISRVIVNLLTNALKFSPPNAPILVQVYRHDADAVIAVTDHGIGIAPEDLPRVFEKHYCAQSAGQSAGYGLGLYSSRLIVEAHGGRLSVESTIGVGSTFTVALPLPTKYL